MALAIHLQVLVGSTTHRRGSLIGQWIAELIAKQTAVTAEYIDLSENGLPRELSMEQHSPSTGMYELESTKQWSARIQKGDGFVFIVPEYNHGYPAVLKNAIDHLYAEWNDKPVGFVGYSGGMSGGIRAVEQLRQVAVELQMAPIRNAVHIPSVQNAFSEAGEFMSEPFEGSAERMTQQLVRWSRVLKEGRERYP